MRILAIDTTARRGSFALAESGAIVDARQVEAPDGFAGAAIGAIDELLGAAGWAVQSIDAFAATSGPGSFTGVRVGLATAKALAEAAGKCVVPVSVLETLASAAQTESYRAAVLDARRDQVFAALYDSKLSEVVEPRVIAWRDFLPLVLDRRPHFVSTDLRIFDVGGAAELNSSFDRSEIPLIAAPLALLAGRRFEAGGGVKPEAVDAAYIRRPDAQPNQPR